jgi:hypothetical protein
MTEPRDVVMAVREAQAKSVARGYLPIWTVYNRPSDYPNGYIARLHLTGDGAMGATDLTIKADLSDIRRVLRLAGLTKMAREPEDMPQIIESWL